MTVRSLDHADRAAGVAWGSVVAGCLFFLLFLSPARAEDAVVPTPMEGQAAEDSVLDPLALSLDQILLLDHAVLQGLPADVLEQLLGKVDAGIKEATESQIAARKSVFEGRVKTRQEHPDVKALQARIEALRQEIEDVINGTPEMVALGEQLEQAGQRQMALGKRRIDLMKAIAVTPAAVPDSGTPAATQGEEQP